MNTSQMLYEGNMRGTEAPTIATERLAQKFLKFFISKKRRPCCILSYGIFLFTSYNRWCLIWRSVHCALYQYNLVFYIFFVLLRFLLLQCLRSSLELMLPPKKCQYLFITNFIDCNDSNWKSTEQRDAKFGHDSSHDHLFTKKKKIHISFYLCNKLELSPQIYRCKLLILKIKISIQRLPNYR